MTKAIDIVKQHQTATPGQWKKTAEWQIKNRKWLRYSQEIALRVLNRMDELNLTQKALAEKMECTQQYVSLLLKGSENLTLETISKLETALEIDLIGEALHHLMPQSDSRTVPSTFSSTVSSRAGKKL